MFLCLPFLSLSLSIASFRFARFIPLSPSTFFLSGSFLPPFVPLTFHGFSFFFFFSTVVFSRERFFRPGTRACSLFWFVVFLPTAWYLRTCITHVHAGELIRLWREFRRSRCRRSTCSKQRFEGRKFNEIQLKRREGANFPDSKSVLGN